MGEEGVDETGPVLDGLEPVLDDRGELVNVAGGEIAQAVLHVRPGALGEVAMLEEYLVKPDTVGQSRDLWIGPEIERYVGWLAGQGYRRRTVLRRVPLPRGFARLAWGRGARTAEDLPVHVDGFVAMRVAAHRGDRRAGAAARVIAKEVRGPVEQMLAVVLAWLYGHWPATS